MSKTTYRIGSQEGADRYGAAIGETVELDLSDTEERALIAAGWLTDNKKPKEAN